MTKHVDCGCLDCHGVDPDEKIEDALEKDGWLGLFIFDANPSFCYSIGLTESFQHAELIIAAPLNPEQFNVMLASAVDLIRGGAKLMEGRVEVNGLSCQFRGITEANKYELMGKAVTRYGADGFEAVQLVIPDSQGRLPGDENCEPWWAENQPLL